MRLIAILGMLGVCAMPSLASADPATTDEARRYIDEFTARVRPLDIATARAWWDANITGKDEDFKRKEEAQNKIDAVLADKASFARVKALKDASSKIDDPITKRAIDVI